ncbi:hypothetical protein SDC9_119897 [bioreactor metagenome]|uniref:Winged helix DNA-binding domain-containing protein n=1 Tax=bioreactor metagenome TaxID=1076179 RepID=A0A645C7F2_9ZZZZ
MLRQLLYQDYELTEGYDKEMCIYQTSEYPAFAELRQKRTASLKEHMIYRRQIEALSLLDEVRRYVSEHQLVSTRDLSIGITDGNNWGHRKLSSVALDYLFNTGELWVADRKATIKYYTMTDKIIGNAVNIFADQPSKCFIDWYVLRRIQAVGALWAVSGSAWLGYYLKDPQIRNAALQRLLADKKICRILVEGLSEPFYCAAADQIYLSDFCEPTPAKIIAPLDNLIWDRKMTSKVFDFTYSWEVYLPKSKRKYGYYVLPVLYQNRFIARFEPLKLAPGQPFDLLNWWWEADVVVDDLMIESIIVMMKQFAAYLKVPYNSAYLSKLRL